MYKKTFLIFLVLVFSGCATSPTGRSQFLLFPEEMAISASKQAYQEILFAFKEDGKLSTDWALAKRVHAITGKLIAQAVLIRPETEDWDWEIIIIDEPETVNAWAMAGGKMSLYTGLIEKLSPTDDELAQVIGHEISHALAKHSAEKMSIETTTQIGIIATVAAAGNKELVLTGMSLAAALTLTLPNSRSMETEADQIGIELAAKAGYDPEAAITLWEKMGELGSQKLPQFLSTHPNPDNRQAKLRTLVEKVRPYYEEKQERPVYELPNP